MGAFSMQSNPWLASLVLLCSILYVPVVSELARLLLYGYLLGAWSKQLLFKTRDNTIMSSVALSIALSASLFLLLGWFASVNSFVVRGCVAIIGAAVFVYSQKRAMSDAPLLTRKQFFIVVLFTLLPLVPVLVINPGTGFISDGWWHYSVFNMVNQNSLPPPNPWLHGETVAYPFVHHVMVSAVFGQTPLAPHILFAITTCIVSLMLVLLAYALARVFYNPEQSLWASFTFYLVSTIGSIFFLWDLLKYLFTSSISAFITFLYTHSGPHMQYAAMKFLYPYDASVGLNIIFNASPLVGSLQYFSMLAVLYFSLKEKYVGAFLSYVVLICSNPIIGLIYALMFGIVGIFKLAHEGVKLATTYFFIILAGGVGAALISSAFLYSLIIKLATASTQLTGDYSSALALFNPKGWWMLLLFIIGYAPLLVLAGMQLREKTYPKHALWLTLALVFASLITIWTLNLGYLYASMTLFFPLAFIAGPQFAKIRTASFAWKSILSVIAIVGVCSTLLISATYAYYVYPIDAGQVRASAVLKEQSTSDAVVLVNMGELNPLKQNLTVYAAVFGARQVLIADVWTLRTYGEEFTAQKKAYDLFWSNPACETIPTAVTHVYSVDGPSLAELTCLDEVYNDNRIHIYRVVAPAVS